MDQVIGAEEAAALGITANELRGPAFRRVGPGLHVRADAPWTFPLAARAALKGSPAGSALCGPTALRAHGIDLPGVLDAERRCHVLVPTEQWGQAPRWSAVVPHRAVPGRLVVGEVLGMPAVGPADAWVEVCPALTPWGRVELGDRLLDYSRPPCTLAQIDAAIDRWSGHRGVGLARQARLAMRAGTESIPETTIRLIIVANGLPEPGVNITITDQNGRFVSRGDLVYSELLIVIEYDGAGHITEAQRRIDAFQRRALQELGYTVIAATANDLRDPRHFLRTLRSAIQQRSRQAA
jgi:hypothetical protein